MSGRPALMAASESRPLYAAHVSPPRDFLLPNPLLDEPPYDDNAYFGSKRRSSLERPKLHRK
jgi:hypothetical protein